MANNDVVGKILLTQDQIWQKAKEMGAQISADYEGEELILIGTLKGAIMWMADIMKNLCLDTQIDFISASSYGSGTTSSGRVKIKKDIELDITGKKRFDYRGYHRYWKHAEISERLFSKSRSEECEDLYPFWINRPEERQTSGLTT